MSHVLVSTSPATSAYTTVSVSSAGESINGVSCPTANFCAAVDGDGNVYVSSDPAATNAASWTEVHDIDSNGAALDGVSCPTTEICIAAGFDGAYVSNDAGAQWSLVSGTSTDHLVGVSCPGGTLCVAVSNGTAALTISDLAAGAAATVTTAANADSISANHFTAVDCPSSGLCLAVDDQGYVAVSTNPAAASWEPDAGAGYGYSIGAIACPMTALCLAVTADGAASFSTNPSAGASSIWSLNGGAAFTPNPLDAIACPQSGFCVSADDMGGVSVGTGAELSVALAGAGGGIRQRLQS